MSDQGSGKFGKAINSIRSLPSARFLIQTGLWTAQDLDVVEQHQITVFHPTGWC